MSETIGELRQRVGNAAIFEAFFAVLPDDAEVTDEMVDAFQRRVLAAFDRMDREARDEREAAKAAALAREQAEAEAKREAAAGCPCRNGKRYCYMDAEGRRVVRMDHLNPAERNLVRALLMAAENAERERATHD